MRDDLFPGGTKARVLSCLFDGRPEYVYASPVQGYAQIALAHAARAAGKTATVFCAARAKEHVRTAEARRAGAKVVAVRPGYLSVVQARAREYCASTGAKLLPFGVDCEEVIEALAGVARSLPIAPAEVWAAAGSGTMIRALQRAWPAARFFAVRVGAEPNVGRAALLVAPEKFEQRAVSPPPFPSCDNYDAKVWQFIRQRASPGALFWNVA